MSRRSRRPAVLDTAASDSWQGVDGEHDTWCADEPAGADGIPIDALDFYDDLAVENTRTWWQATKDRYLRSVRAPLDALLAALEDEFGAAHVPPQPRRAVQRGQFAVQGPPGALAATVPGMGFYVQVSAAGSMTPAAVSTPRAPTRCRDCGRRSTARARGRTCNGSSTQLVGQGFELGGDRVATRPRGVAADHPGCR